MGVSLKEKIAFVGGRYRIFMNYYGERYGQRAVSASERRRVMRRQPFSAAGTQCKC